METLGLGMSRVLGILYDSGVFAKNRFNDNEISSKGHISDILFPDFIFVLF